MPAYNTSRNRRITTGKSIGKGGEAIVYEIQGYNDQVLKIYHQNLRTSDKEQKLESMILNPPKDETRSFLPPHISIAWPIDIVYDQQQFVGYIMPFIGHSSNIFEIYNPKLRKSKHHHGFDWRALHRTARNLATAFNALHAHDYVVGDVNQKNILVAQNTLITIIDTDSFQVRDKNKRTYHCPVGVPEFTPPELHGKNLNSMNREPFHDSFGLSVLIFQLLMEGFHPFTGALKDLSRSIRGEIYLHCIKNGIFPYQSNPGFNPPPDAPDFGSLCPEVQKLFIRCFINGYNRPPDRPTPLDWINVLDIAEKKLKQCGMDSSHWYSGHLNECNWCKRKNPLQTPMPPPQKPMIGHNPNMHKPKSPKRQGKQTGSFLKTVVDLVKRKK